MVLLNIMRASAVFPFSTRIREGEAIVHTGVGDLPPSLTVLTLRRAYYHSPNSPQIAFWLITQLVRLGEMETAREAVNRLEVLAPNWPQTRLARQLVNQEERP